MAELVWVYVTCADEDEARRLARELVEERLAACANVIPGLFSTYWWEGKREEAREAALILKSTAARVEKLMAEIRARHSYSTPAILVLPVLAANPEFARWVKETVGDEA
ncbi:CutA1 divalent ion tolerance protein [Ammonifex degensii KC4]|uniref:CutA1 divalent ion tolerance protein n=1 Tax=Ammonifex degensii (strain DSM 10501 / KC4) TaxID=429009 RepID=C9RAA5_AMMDK|nr:divalent-cation tolerance protein CutA [Ammonifex degensii]ACX51214.1 CutA1 divalent ion tolerance protein [Ammonifex degensii KC4]